MRTLLITDDHEGVLRTLEYVLAGRGHRTLLAKSGAAALEAARSEQLDAALVDLHMPVMDGLSLCRALRRQAIANGTDIPVWIMTAAAVPALAAKALEAGAVCVLRKPFDPDEFMAAVEEICSGTKPFPPPPSVDAPFSPLDFDRAPGGSNPAPAR